MNDILKDKVVLVTGGTGSFGQKFTAKILREHAPAKLIIYSRDEMKQFEMAQHFNESKYPAIRYFIGDIRDRERLYRALDGVDIVIHAAALKIVPAAEYNPIEAVRTNILGAAKIGISSVIQPEGHEGETVPLILMLHDAPNGAVTKALKKIAGLPVVVVDCISLMMDALPGPA
jgi:uncharacterized protein YbjT (DUF2867 family)